MSWRICLSSFFWSDNLLRSWPSGDVYTGGFRENMRSGKGTVINLKRGLLFVGEYRNNRKHGVVKRKKQRRKRNVDLLLLSCKGYSIECGICKREVWDNDELVSQTVRRRGEMYYYFFVCFLIMFGFAGNFVARVPPSRRG